MWERRVSVLPRLSFPFLSINAFKYRDRATIMSDILKSVRGTNDGRKLTQIMQTANLNYTQTKKYLSYLNNCGYLVVTERETYVITERGSKFLQMIEFQMMHSIR
jgi:predicted transcriptional regulator